MRHSSRWFAAALVAGLASVSSIFAADGKPEELLKDAGPLPEIKPLVELPVRDTSIILHDGVYYMTGTTGAPAWWKTNEGLRVWKSTDLKKWDDLGLVWTFDRDATWAETFDKAGRRAVWAPEIHFVNGTFWLAYSMNFERGGTGLLKSTSGKPEGPYVDVKKDGPLTSGIDASLFQDDDGKVYFVWQDGKIREMNKDLTGFAGPEKFLKPANFKHVGFEAAFLFKADGKYYLSCADFITNDGENQYHSVVASSENLFGPYGDRYIAVRNGGHNSFFKDKDGNWWSTFFGNDAKAPFKERAAIVPVHFDEDGKISTKAE